MSKQVKPLMTESSDGAKKLLQGTWHSQNVIEMHQAAISCCFELCCRRTFLLHFEQ